MKLNTALALRPRARGQRLIKPRIIRTLCIDGRLDPLQPIEFKTHAPKLPAPELKLAHKLSVVEQDALHFGVAARRCAGIYASTASPTVLSSSSRD